ncbi:MAG: hypothetical protein IJW62_06295 [Clostridia bacterium]|nr:hypothetical protein [Clostridia bacterium]
MKSSKAQTGTKVKKTKSKRVSLRCPLSIERTDLEYNFDTSAIQVCMTVENMGGGGLASDTVESAVIVVRLFEADGKIHPCKENEYFAKLLRFGDAGLESGARITFRLLPDCDGGTRVEDAEIYISRVRYTDGTVTDYVRGDFFDLPGEGVPIAKRFKKDPDAAAAALGIGALYVPEKLTEIVWRCTCGEFSESDACPTCRRNKSELFAALDGLTASKNKKAVVAPIPAPTLDPSADDNLPASDKTAEYSTAAAKAALAAMAAENGTAEPDSDPDNGEVPPPVPAVEEKSPDKARNALLIAITAASVVLLIIVLLLILTLCGKEDSDSTDTTTGQTTGDTIPGNADDGAEKIVRTYLEQNDFVNALGYAQTAGCDQALIDEIYTAAIQYYTTANLLDKALEWAQKTGNQAYIDAIRTQQFYAALNDGDYVKALALAKDLPADQQAGATAQAAEAYIKALTDEGKYTEAMEIARQYNTATTPATIAKSAVQALLDQNQYDEAIAMAEEFELPELAASASAAAVDYYIGKSDYGKAADYVSSTGDPVKMQTIMENLTNAELRRHMPTFFSLLTVYGKQTVNATLISAQPQKVASVDSDGNVYLGGNMIYSATSLITGVDPITGEPTYESVYLPAVSVSCCDAAVVILLLDGTVRIADGSNASYKQEDLAEWTEIVAISAGNYHLLGLKADGTVVAAGSNLNGQCDTAELQNAVSIAAGDNHSLILHSDGTVTALGNNLAGICNTSDWSDIIAISAGTLHSIGLKADGTVVVLGNCKITDATDVIAISSNANNAALLKADGSVITVALGGSDDSIAQISDALWVTVGKQFFVVLHSDGTLTTHGTVTPELPTAWQTTVFGTN